jgi:hypothetical protein
MLHSLIYDSYEMIFLINCDGMQEYIFLFYSVNLVIFYDVVINVFMRHKIIQFENVIFILHAQIDFQLCTIIVNKSVCLNQMNHLKKEFYIEYLIYLCE